MGEYRMLIFLAISPKLKIFWYFEIPLNIGPYGLEISKHHYSYSFHPISAKLYEDNFAYMYLVGILAVTFLGDWPSFKIL